jgi:hypothetical protein
MDLNSIKLDRDILNYSHQPHVENCYVEKYFMQNF